jgi:hypothetical protein
LVTITETVEPPRSAWSIADSRKKKISGNA